MNPQHFAYICERAQKITEAVYRVTDLLPDQEPLKWDIREKAVAVFSGLVSIKKKNVLEKKNSFENIENLIGQLIMIFPLFSGSRITSSINFEILKDEYDSIKKVIFRERQKQGFNILPQAQEKPLELIATAPAKKVSDKLSDRKSRILEIMKNKKEITIGEISSVFTECSEKTIQRDLLGLVDRGILKKKGDKRWRKYSLIP